MAEMITRKLPAGIQFFSIIRKEGYLYVDKTDLVGGVSEVNVEEQLKKDYNAYSLNNLQSLIGKSRPSYSRVLD